MTKAVAAKKAPAKKTAATTAKPSDAAKLPANLVTVPVKDTAVAYGIGLQYGVSSARSCIAQSKALGSALDAVIALEQACNQQMQGPIMDTLVNAKAQTSFIDWGTGLTPDGKPAIFVVPQEMTPERLEQKAMLDAVNKKAAADARKAKRDAAATAPKVEQPSIKNIVAATRRAPAKKAAAAVK